MLQFIKVFALAFAFLVAFSTTIETLLVIERISNATMFVANGKASGIIFQQAIVGIFVILFTGIFMIVVNRVDTVEVPIECDLCGAESDFEEEEDGQPIFLCADCFFEHEREEINENY